MRLVKLYTASGGFVVAGRVPNFMSGHEAQVLLWGDRVFKLDREDGVVVSEADGALRYIEVFAVALVDTTAEP